MYALTPSQTNIADFRSYGCSLFVWNKVELTSALTDDATELRQRADGRTTAVTVTTAIDGRSCNGVMADYNGSDGSCRAARLAS